MTLILGVCVVIKKWRIDVQKNGGIERVDEIIISKNLWNFCIKD